MAYLIVLIIDDPDDCPAILEGWEAIGIGGITILESSGLGRFRRAGMLDNLPLMPSMRDLFEKGETHHRTLLSVVEDQEKVDQMVTTAKRIIGDLETGHTGFLFVVPVVQAHGLGKRRWNGPSDNAD